MVKVTMLGRCGAYPTAGEATTGFLLQTKEANVLVDCGSGIAERLQRYLPLESLDAVLISHYHHDHIADLGVLQYGVMITQRRGTRTRPLQTYLPTADEQAFRRYQFDPWCVSTGIAPESVIDISGLRITFLATKHPVPCLAMRFEHQGTVICFSGDSALIPELIPFVKDSDLFICETNFYANEDGSVTQHLTSAEVSTIASGANVKHVVMTHLPAYGDHEQLRREVMHHYHGMVQLAETGLTVTF